MDFTGSGKYSSIKIFKKQNYPSLWQIFAAKLLSSQNLLKGKYILDNVVQGVQQGHQRCVCALRARCAILKVIFFEIHAWKFSHKFTQKDHWVNISQLAITCYLITSNKQFKPLLNRFELKQLGIQSKLIFETNEWNIFCNLLWKNAELLVDLLSARCSKSFKLENSPNENISVKHPKNMPSKWPKLSSKIVPNLSNVQIVNSKLKQKFRVAYSFLTNSIG